MAVTRRARHLRYLLAGWAVAVSATAAPRTAAAQDSTAVRVTGDSVSVRFVDADLRAVIAALGHYLPKPVLAGNVPALRSSLETPRPVSRATVAALLRGLVESHG